jgi:hypothetical protein
LPIFSPIFCGKKYFFKNANIGPRIALAIVWLFIFCHAWRLIPTIYEALYTSADEWPAWLLHIQGSILQNSIPAKK